MAAQREMRQQQVTASIFEGREEEEI